jgi:hypothetical protein
MPDRVVLDVEPEETASLDIAFKTLDALAVDLERMQALRELFLQASSELVAIVLQLPELTRQRWQQLRAAGMSGHTDQVHALRPLFLKGVDTRIGQVKQAMRIADMAAVLGNQNLAGSEKLPRVLQDLEQLKSSIFGQWNTLEDLEDMLAAQFPLPTEKLEALGRKYQPPPAWYEQEGKPF